MSYKNKKTSNKKKNKNEIYEDEYGKCKTFSKIGVRFDDRIEKIKKIVQEKFRIPYDEQLLVYKDKILKHDYKQLKAYHIRNYSRIHVFDKRDVKENLDDIDPYSIDQDFVKELANSCLPDKNNNSSRKRVDTVSTKESLNGNRDQKSVRSTSNNNVADRYDRYRNNLSDDDDDKVSKSQFISESKNNVKAKYLNQDIKKNSISCRRVRKLDELLDNSVLMYAK